MSGELESVVRELFAALDRADPEDAVEKFATDMQGIDEVSRRWLQGGDEVAEHVRGLVAQVEDIHSELREVRESVWGDVGLVTFWLEQDYTHGGERQHVSAPTSAVLRREDGEWRLALFHSYPLPEEPDS